MTPRWSHRVFRGDPLCRVAVLVLWAACDHPPPQVNIRELPAPAPVPADQIAAEVNGRAISLAEVATQARAAGTTSKEALAALVNAELLSREAERRGLVADPEVQVTAKREAVRVYLQKTFEKEVTPDNAVDESMLHKAYDRQLGRLVHPAIRLAEQILILSDKENANARELAEKIREKAARAQTIEQFKQVATEFQDTGRQLGLGVTLQEGTTARHGSTVEEFAKATFDLKQPGDVSPVVRTKFGYHIIWLTREIPEENITFKQAAPKIREGLWPAVQQRAFAKMQEKLADQHQVTTYPARLSQIKDDDALPF